MKNLSIRSWVLLGFIISIIGILLNVPVVSELNNRIRDTETELSGVKESLRTQASEISIADLQNNLATILLNISKSQTGEQKISAGEDSIYVLQTYLQRVYAAANDISAVDILKLENEKLTGDIRSIEKAKELEKKTKEGNAAEIERLVKEAEDLQKAHAQPKFELDKKIKDFLAPIDPDKLADKSGYEITLETVPLMKVVNEQFITGFQKKEAKIKELEARKEYLSWWANILNYLAISLQMFGLLCVLNKDLPIQVIQEDVSEVKEDTKEVLSDMKIMKNESQEAKDLLAELEEDLRSTIEDVEKKNN